MTFFLELSSVAIFLIYLHHAWKNKNLPFIFSATILALLVEDIFISLFAHETGGYVYSNSFNLVLHNTPIFIILFWASIIYSSYFLLKDRVSQKQFYFLMPLSVLSLDIVMDIVAVDFGLWTWFGFENYQGILSIPPANYLAWLLLPFCFVITWDHLGPPLLRRGEGLGVGLKFLQPFLAFLLFLALNLPLFYLKKCTCDTNLVGQWSIFLLALLIFIVLSIARKGKEIPSFQTKKPKGSLCLVRLYIHIFSLIGLIYLDLFWDSKILLIVLLILVFEILLIRKIKE